MNFKNIWNSPSFDLYIDLGTANTLVMHRHRGLIANEPSVIAYREVKGRKVTMSVGSQARHNIGRTPENYHTCFPLREGVIADMDTTECMLRYFINKAKGSVSILRPRVVISLPYGVSAVERRAVIEAGMSAGARDVVLVEEPMLAAIGSNLPVHAPQGNMIIDIGAGTTEIAVISLNEIVHCESLRIGGNTFDRSIVDYIKDHYNLVIGEPSAEKIKMDIGCVQIDEPLSFAAARGLDFATNLPKELPVSSSDILTALHDHINQILDATRKTIEAIPPELIPDIVDQGISIVGGGALLRGLASRFHQALRLPIQISPHALTAVARGGLQVLNSNSLSNILRAV
jgi:rod shape-determining protein MreB